jgi:hypothetical protein
MNADGAGNCFAVTALTSEDGARWRAFLRGLIAQGRSRVERSGLVFLFRRRTWLWMPVMTRTWRAAPEYQRVRASSRRAHVGELGVGSRAGIRWW